MEQKLGTLPASLNRLKTKVLVRMVETSGLEPPTPCVQSRCSSQLSYVPRAFLMDTHLSRRHHLGPNRSSDRAIGRLIGGSALRSSANMKHPATIRAHQGQPERRADPLLDVDHRAKARNPQQGWPVNDLRDCVVSGDLPPLHGAGQGGHHDWRRE